jgi:OHCU decarboxylase
MSPTSDRTGAVADDARPIEPRPSTMTREAFVARFGGIYEHSPWIAEAVWGAAGPGPDCDTVAGLAAAMAAALDAAPRAAKLALIRAHPDLAGKAAVAGALTADSAAEQAGAGLDRCSPEEFARFQQLNAAYKAKFGFPFIIAVRGLGRAAILAAFERRLGNDAQTEFATALGEINRIALLRLASG